MKVNTNFAGNALESRKLRVDFVDSVWWADEKFVHGILKSKRPI